jgi:hypothetical protein
LIIITRKETTKARTTLCSSLPLLRLSPVGDLASTVESASAAYFGITVAPHEYFDQTTSQLVRLDSSSDAAYRGQSRLAVKQHHEGYEPRSGYARRRQCDRRHLGIPGAAAIRIARSRNQVLLGVSGNARGWWYKTDSTPSAESKPECLRQKMGAIGERGMLIENNLVRRSLAATRPDRFH